MVKLVYCPRRNILNPVANHPLLFHLIGNLTQLGFLPHRQPAIGKCYIPEVDGTSITSSDPTTPRTHPVDPFSIYRAVWSKYHKYFVEKPRGCVGFSLFFVPKIPQKSILALWIGA